jgi:hypothetical protein
VKAGSGDRIGVRPSSFFFFLFNGGHHLLGNVCQETTALAHAAVKAKRDV